MKYIVIFPGSNIGWFMTCVILIMYGNSETNVSGLLFLVLNTSNGRTSDLLRQILKLKN